MTLPAVKEGAVRTLLTWEEYRRLPETMQRYEIIDGERIMSPAPDIYHQWISSEINEHLKRFARRRRLGVVLYAPLDILIRREPRLRTRQPDVLFIGKARLGRGGMQRLLRTQALEFAPDLAVEILSPDESRHDIEDKLADYAAVGVREVWLVSPEAETVETLALREGRYERAGLLGRGDTIVSTVLPGLALKVDAIFQ